ncbi:MAG: glycosyltransferase N-terminal domain-containing protein [Sediminibacterium sp.]|nr:glycosyltransferase N-terminal domain-containing protein [Sediminibacterium sp.]MDP1811655.1 glycosyltransferase N-terminal domain-containing protein [Sediminibacterium sp.]MDP3127413.1 glycosyltransferase N-terminal domain-containing protein [Sediminibacterium sp.]MDP3667106.1 glycosyltransferase N-terminal domain-containing protein [Sediminibacterium sp.]
MLLYRLFTWLYPKLAWLISFANPKASLWLKGRRGLFKKLALAFHTNKQPVVWMHCSSLGEFEQGLPVLESIRKQYPGYTVLLTFFSPSGFEIRKNYKGADHIFYLPMDTPAHANRFFNIVQPSLVLFVKYEFWYYYLQEASQRNIPTVLVSGIFRKDQPFFQWYGGVHKKMLTFFSKIFVQSEASAELLAGIGFHENVLVCGDTRFDRVIEIARNFEPLELISHFCREQPVIIAGSTWTEDDEELVHYTKINGAVKYIIAPHDIDEDRLQECLALYKNAMRYSVYETIYRSGNGVPENPTTLIIDNMGMLSRLYHYATICYIGGGFGDDGIHNILEAAVYGKPVVFGPVYDKYFEADELLDVGGAFSIENSLELEDILKKLLENQELYSKSASASAEYVLSKAGATEKLMAYIEANRLLTN